MPKSSRKIITYLNKMGYPLVKQKTVEELILDFEKDFADEDLRRGYNGQYKKIAVELMWYAYLQCAVSHRLIQGK